MTGRERLEEIKNSHLRRIYSLFGTPWVSIRKENLDWLINRIDELEKVEYALQEIYRQERKYNKKLEEQNKRYKQALEFYAERDNYQWEVSYRPQQEIDCMVIDDSGHTARKALEGEK